MYQKFNEFTFIDYNSLNNLYIKNISQISSNFYINCDTYKNEYVVNVIKNKI